MKKDIRCKVADFLNILLMTYLLSFIIGILINKIFLNDFSVKVISILCVLIWIVILDLPALYGGGRIFKAIYLGLLFGVINYSYVFIPIKDALNKLRKNE